MNVILTRSAKNKGKRLQNWVRDKLIETFPMLDEEDVKSTLMGDTGLDIQLSKPAQQFINFGFECKNMAKIAVYNFYEQAQRGILAINKRYEPVVIIKGDHKKPLAVVDAEHFFKLARAYYDISAININKPNED